MNKIAKAGLYTFLTVNATYTVYKLYKNFKDYKNKEGIYAPEEVLEAVTDEVTGEIETVEEAGIKEGDKLQVKLLDIDPKTGKYKLSRRCLLEKPEGYVEPQRRPRGDRGERRPRREDNHRS